MEIEKTAGETVLGTSQENPTPEDMRDVVAQALSRSKGETKRGRGRPKKEDGDKSHKPPSTPQTKNLQRDTPFELSPDDRKMIGGLVATLFGGLDAFLMGRIHKIAIQVTTTENAKKMIDDCKLSEFELVQMQNLIITLCQKYEISARWCPEVGLVIVLGGYTVRVITTLKELNELVASMDAAKQKEQ